MRGRDGWRKNRFTEEQIIGVLREEEAATTAEVCRRHGISEAGVLKCMQTNRRNAMPEIRQKISPFLWFNDQAEEAARFYTSLFDDSRMVDIAHYTAANPAHEGLVMLVTFELAGQRFYALNGGPNGPFNESVSLLVECETQKEVDRLWSQLTEGGTEAPCGWLKDRYGLAWQITPKRLLELVTGPDRKIAEVAMRAMFEMKKIVIDDIERAVAAR
jgi:predicted 3-demethylubiquinone-9 3-methyltransferase (glyoxalase superfamily)